MVMDILRCTSLICNKLHVLNKLAWLLTRVSRHHHVYAFKNTYLVQSMEWRYVHTCSFIYHTGKIHRITPFWCWVLFNLSTFYDRCYMLGVIHYFSLHHHPPTGVWMHSLSKWFKLQPNRLHFITKVCWVCVSDLRVNCVVFTQIGLYLLVV